MQKKAKTHNRSRLEFSKHMCDVWHHHVFIMEDKWKNLCRSVVAHMHAHDVYLLDIILNCARLCVMK